MKHHHNTEKPETSKEKKPRKKKIDSSNNNTEDNVETSDKKDTKADKKLLPCHLCTVRGPFLPKTILFCQVRR